MGRIILISHILCDIYSARFYSCRIHGIYLQHFILFQVVVQVVINTCGLGGLTVLATKGTEAWPGKKRIWPFCVAPEAIGSNPLPRVILCQESLCWQELWSCLAERLCGIYCINVLWLIFQKGSTFKEKSIKKAAAYFWNGQEGSREREGNISIIDIENNKPWIIFIECDWARF